LLLVKTQVENKMSLVNYLTWNGPKVVVWHQGAGLAASGRGQALSPIAFVAALLPGGHLALAVRKLVPEFTSLKKMKSRD
jgi:hypothetical protein